MKSNVAIPEVCQAQPPMVNAGIYALIQRTYKLLSDIYNYGSTPEGAILSELDYIQTLDNNLSNVVSTLTDCIGQEICESAQDAVGYTEPDNNRKFADDEHTGE